VSSDFHLLFRYLQNKINIYIFSAASSDQYKTFYISIFPFSRAREYVTGGIRGHEPRTGRLKEFLYGQAYTWHARANKDPKNSK
jgi:hypothetical protein